MAATAATPAARTTSTLRLEARVVKAGGTTPEVLQRRLARVAEAVNERYGVILKQALQVEEGGRLVFEVELAKAPGGVLDGAVHFVELICELSLRLPPVRCLFAMLPAAADGSCSMDHAFEEARHERLFLVADGFGGQDSASITGAFAGIGVLIWGWTERQSQFVRALLREGVVAVDPATPDRLHFVAERKRREIAAAFKVSPSVVTECLQAAQVRRFRYQVWATVDLLYRILS